MWHVVHLLLRAVLHILGLFCLLTSLLLYTDEEGKIQNRLEDFWVRVDDYQRLALSRHAAFMVEVAKLETGLFDYLFGHKLISLQAVTISICFSNISTWLTLYGGNVNVTHRLVLQSAASSLALALLFLLIPSRPFRWVVAGLSLVPAIVVLRAWSTKWDESLPVFFAIVVGGFLSDLAFVVITRRLLRWAGDMSRSLTVVGVIVLNVLLAFAMVGLYYPANYVIERMIGSDYTLVNTVIWESALFAVGTAASNGFDVLLALLFVILALILLLHRGVWPLIGRTLFRIQDIGTKSRRAILASVGVGLLGLPQLLKQLIEKLVG
jgi:hypothetical protein